MDQNKQYDTILFDWDGTLSQTIPIWETTFKSVFEQLHMPIDINHTTEQLWLDSAILNDLGIEHEGFFDLVYEKLGEDFTVAPLYEKVKETLIEIQNMGITMSLVTSTRKKQIQKALEYHQLESFFSVVIGSEDVTNHKPSAEPYETALLKINKQKEKTLIIGDSKFDLIGSINSGIDSVLSFPKINEKYYRREDLIQYQPKYIVNSINQVLEILNNNHIAQTF